MRQPWPFCGRRWRGVTHIDTSDFYGPHVTNQLIREALQPYPADLVIVIKIGAFRGASGSWPAAFAREHIIRATHNNLRNLGVDVLDAVNLRVRNDMGPLEAPLSVFAELREQGLIRHVGLSGVSPAQLAQGRAMLPIVCVQNVYNIAQRKDDAMVDELARDGIAYVPFFPLGGFTRLQSATLSVVADRLGATPMQVALALLLHRSPNVLLIPGTSSVAHLRENLAVSDMTLSALDLSALDAS